MYSISVTSEIDSEERIMTDKTSFPKWRFSPAQNVPKFETKPAANSFGFLPTLQWPSDKTISYRSQPCRKPVTPSKNESRNMNLDFEAHHTPDCDFKNGEKETCKSIKEMIGEDLSSSSGSNRVVRLPENFSKSPKEGISSIGNTPTAGSEKGKDKQEMEIIEVKSKVSRPRKLSLAHQSPSQTPHLLSPSDVNTQFFNTKPQSAHSDQRPKSTKSQKRVTFCQKKMVMLYDQSTPIPDKTPRIGTISRN